MIRHIVLPICVSFFPFTAVATDAPLGSHKLSVTTVDGTGQCLVDDRWIPVKGEKIYWEITSKGRPQWHLFNRFKPTEKAENATPSSRLNTPFHFQINLSKYEIGESNYSAIKGFMEQTWSELAYAENISARLKKPNLIPAVMIQSVSESDLYKLNRLNDDTPFRDEFSDKKIEVPVRYSVCEMQLTYGMKRAVAYFEKDFFGRVKILKDETRPHRGSQKTFAEKLLLGK
ncbi:MAG: hypothetical protein O3A09_03910 [Bacteroidetes bacterium]|nr:hypothetical protein [Bacteroidota bacterium]